MAAVILSVVGKYDGKDLDRAQKSLDRLKKEAGLAQGPLAKIGDTFKSAGKSMTSFGKTMTTHVTMPLVAAGYGVKQAIDAASDLAETQSKVGVLFGKSASEIEKFASTAASALGQSKQEAMDAAATFATFGKSAGLSGNKLVGFSTQMTTLASDMASFSNTSPEEAITAIGAALRGENEPIRRYGVLLDDASMRQEALKLGIVKTTKDALTPQQKVLAAQSLILKQTTAAQGDFERTSGGLANQQRILRAELKNVETEMGNALLPIALKLASFFSRKVVPAIQAVADWFGGLSDKTKTIIIIAGVAVAALGPLITVIGTLATAVGFLMSPIGLVALAIGALVAGAIYAYKHFEGFREVVDKSFTAIKEAAVVVFDWLKAHWRQILDIITKPFQIAAGFVQRHLGAIKQYIQGALQVITGIFDVFAGLFTGDWSRMWEGLKDIVAGAGKMVLGQLRLFVGAIWDTFKGLPGKLVDIGKNIVTGIWDGITGMGSWFMSQLGNWVDEHIPGWMKKVLGIASPSKVTSKIGEDVARGMAQGIGKQGKAVKDAGTKLTSAVIAAAKEKVKAAQDVFSGLRDAGMDALDKIKNKAQDVLDFAKGIADSVRAFGGVTTMEITDGQPVTGAGVIGNMKSRLATVKKFGEQLKDLAKLGLNNSSLQEIIAAGPDVGSQIAGALLADGQSAINEVNSLESQLSNVSKSIGDIGAQSEYGMSTADAKAIVESTVVIQSGAVVLQFGDGISNETAQDLKATVDAAVEKAMNQLGDRVITDARITVHAGLQKTAQAINTAKKSKKKRS